MPGTTTGIWISANSATVLRWSPQGSLLHRVVSTVPGRHRSTGRPPTEAHPASEGRRDEHMRTFFDEVARVLPGEDDLLLVGDGEVVDHFAEYVQVRRRPPRSVAPDRGREERSAHRPATAGPPAHICGIAGPTYAAALGLRDATRRLRRRHGQQDQDQHDRQRGRDHVHPDGDLWPGDAPQGPHVPAAAVQLLPPSVPRAPVTRNVLGARWSRRVLGRTSSGPPCWFVMRYLSAAGPTWPGTAQPATGGRECKRTMGMFGRDPRRRSSTPTIPRSCHSRSGCGDTGAAVCS